MLPILSFQFLLVALLSQFLLIEGPASTWILYLLCYCLAWTVFIQFCAKTPFSLFLYILNLQPSFHIFHRVPDFNLSFQRICRVFFSTLVKNVRHSLYML